jgi:uroporphyrinogen-III decarboxylase
MLDTLNVDILSIEDITPQTKTIKMGGVSTQTILYGNKAKIKAEVKRALEQAPFILSTSCDVPPETNPSNIKEMIKYASLR